MDSDSAVAAEPPRLFPAGVTDWDRLRRLPPNSGHIPPPGHPRPMVSIKDAVEKKPPIVFPPVNHENLLVSTDPSPVSNLIPRIHTDNHRIRFTDSDSDSETTNSLSTAFSPSDSSPAPRSPLSFAPPESEQARRIGSWTELLHSTLSVLARYLYSGLTSSRGVLVTFRSAAFTAVLLAFMYFQRRRRLRTAERSRIQLINIMRDGDEKMNQVLEQISQMNQMLRKLHSSQQQP
ncbi:uncharacterized protein LOC127255168 [Andrographis paniculata]|uniref:uncharacterized protein LOC127255168 n=1 Tax=Andrographis paniculata TaxID=175694 RepID=UPI0021E7030D|nr:uncharacterized protein LOC127255168 [Andrographis paniculata]